MSQLKICILTPDFTLHTGANSQAFHLALKLKELGARVCMVFSLNSAVNTYKPCYNKAHLEKVQAAGIPVYQKPEDMPAAKWPAYKFYLQLFWRLRHEYQVIYINGITSMVCWFTLFFKLMGKKVAIKMTGMGINDPASLKNRPDLNWLNLKSLLLADRFIGTSTALCDAYRQSKLLPEAKLAQIPNGVDTKLFAPLHNEAQKRKLKEKLHLPLEDKIVTYVGTVRRQKGIDLLIDCWERVITQYPKATLLIIGPLCPVCPTIKYLDQEFIDTLKNKVGLHLFQEQEKIKLLIFTKEENKIQVLGIKENINEYLQASDVFLFLSRREGMPNALMEAMASGLPCVTLDIGEISGDLITHQKVGHALAEENTEVMIQSIIELLADEAKRSEIGKTARRKMVAEYAIEKIARRHYSLYQQLLKAD